MSAVETRQEAGHDRALKGGFAAALGDAVANAEEVAIDLATRRIYRLRMRHPYLYGLAAFIVGGGFIGIFTMTTYANWTFEGVNLTAALYQVLLGGLGGGIASVVLAFGYAASVRGTRVLMKSAGISQTPKQNFV